MKIIGGGLDHGRAEHPNALAPAKSLCGIAYHSMSTFNATRTPANRSARSKISVVADRLAHTKPFTTSWTYQLANGAEPSRNHHLSCPARVFLLSDILMASKTYNRKNRGRGRPPTGIGNPVGLRLYPDLEKRIDEWRQKEPDRPGRPEAIRRLIVLALSRQGGPWQRSPRMRAKAQELASGELDKVVDQAATNEQREQRKRRLLQGPKEFRDIRNNVRSKSKL